MTGESLHTKYRPKTFEEVVGQDHVTKPLAEAIERGTQQAFLFEGPSGTGKTTLARLVADKLGQLELVEVDAATNSGVDDMRKIAEQQKYQSFTGGGTAFIIDECHRLSKNAWDSLLKDIEEPPEGVYWFFCTTEPTKIPKTIMTRCQAFSLRDVAYRALLRLVARVAEAEGIDLSEDILDVAADMAAGSPRQALMNLATVRSADNVKEATAMLNRAPASATAFELAKMISKPAGWSMAQATVLLKSMHDAKETPEGIRHTVRGYLTTMAMNNNAASYHLFVLAEFCVPCHEHNQMSEILLKVARCHKMTQRGN